MELVRPVTLSIVSDYAYLLCLGFSAYDTKDLLLPSTTGHGHVNGLVTGFAGRHELFPLHFPSHRS